jgi:hypothetical protein
MATAVPERLGEEQPGRRAWAAVVVAAVLSAERDRGAAEPLAGRRAVRPADAYRQDAGQWGRRELNQRPGETAQDAAVWERQGPRMGRTVAAWTGRAPRYESGPAEHVPGPEAAAFAAGAGLSVQAAQARTARDEPGRLDAPIRVTAAGDQMAEPEQTALAAEWGAAEAGPGWRHFDAKHSAPRPEDYQQAPAAHARDCRSLKAAARGGTKARGAPAPLARMRRRLAPGPIPCGPPERLAFRRRGAAQAERWADAKPARECWVGEAAPGAEGEPHAAVRPQRAPREHRVRHEPP